MQHECKITVLETKVFPNIRKNILRIQSQVHVRFLRKGTHLY